MNEVVVSISELKARLSKYLQGVKNGQTIVITSHGKPIGRIVPEGLPLEVRLNLLVKSGLIEWNGEKIRRRPAITVNPSDRLVSDIVVEQRD